MELVPIPQEAVERTIRTTKIRVISQIRGKLEQKATTRDDKTLQRITLKMSKYITDTTTHSADDVDSIIDDMYRSIICLQKRKTKLQQYKKRRK
ncbi:MAG: hypothetical protein ABID64_01430 [Nitrospirota bacterium]